MPRPIKKQIILDPTTEMEIKKISGGAYFCSSAQGFLHRKIIIERINFPFAPKQQIFVMSVLIQLEISYHFV